MLSSIIVYQHVFNFFLGVYNGKVYSGKYGDLGATVAAILLEPEARSVMLDYDPTFGRLREPLLKVGRCEGRDQSYTP